MPYKIIAQIPQPYNICVAHKPITTLQQGPLVFQLTYCLKCHSHKIKLIIIIIIIIIVIIIIIIIIIIN